MGRDSKKHSDKRTPIAERQESRGLTQLLAGVTRENLLTQVLAGVTLLAIAIPEQLATAQLAEVPAFTAMIAFMTATLVFFFVGSNPIVSVGADSTIAPLFAVALLRLALPASSQYLALAAATAVVTGLILMTIGLFKLGWLADFLSLPSSPASCAASASSSSCTSCRACLASRAAATRWSSASTRCCTTSTT
jgi:MFS superfamily sulfate permease-like transporter